MRPHDCGVRGVRHDFPPRRPAGAPGEARGVQHGEGGPDRQAGRRGAGHHRQGGGAGRADRLHDVPNQAVRGGLLRQPRNAQVHRLGAAHRALPRCPAGAAARPRRRHPGIHHGPSGLEVSRARFRRRRAHLPHPATRGRHRRRIRPVEAGRRLAGDGGHPH